MLETAVEMDDAVMEKYLGGTEPTIPELKECIVRRGTVIFKFVPVPSTVRAFKFAKCPMQPMLRCRHRLPAQPD